MRPHSTEKAFIMHTTERALKIWINHPLTNKKFADELLEKTDFVVKDGLFDHHVTFFHIGHDGFYYYKTFFGKGWHKRKPDSRGWIKFLNCLAYNVQTGQIVERRKVFDQGN